MKETFLNMLATAKAEGITFADLCRRFLQSNGKFQSLVKDYIIRSGKVPDVGVVAQGAQAGFLVLSQIEPENLQEFLELKPGFIPTKFRKYPFYNMAETSPATFLSCLFLAGENPQLVSNWDWFEEKKAQVKQGLENLGDWGKKTIDNAADFVRDTAGKAADVGKKIYLAPFRAPFLLLVRANVFNLGRRMYGAIGVDRQKVKNFWENEIGGDFAQLVTAANLGKKEMPILPGKSQTFNVSNFEPATTTAAAATATPVTTLAVKFLTTISAAAVSAYLAKEGLADEEGNLDSEKAKERIEKEAKERAELEIKKLVENATPEQKKVLEKIQKEGGNIFPGIFDQAPEKDNTLLYVIGGAAVLLAILFIGRK